MESGDWDIMGKVCLVTGANCGLGRETVLELIHRGAGRVIMACRNMESGREALAYVRDKAGITDDEEAERCLSLRQLDLASLESVRKFANEIKAHEKQLHVLINNAGVLGPAERLLTEDGFELTFGTNHLGHFLLTTLLLDLLKQSAPSRVVVLASRAYRYRWPWGFPIDDPNFEKGGYGAYASYASSKLANMLFALELDKKLNADGPSGVTVYSLHPGVILTNLFRHRHWLLTWIGENVFSYFFSTPEQGIMTTIYCATEPGIEKFSGKYFQKCGVAEPLAIGKDEAMATRLWNLSETLVSSPKST